jgi:hypothetical protein
MELLVNDLSLHGQFSDLASFRDAVQRVMKIRQIAKCFGRELHCHRNIACAKVTSDMEIPQAVRALNPNEQRSFMQWLTRYGPFWEDARNHGQDDLIEHRDQVVTDTAIGEAAWCCLNGIERGLVSFTPSDWCFSPVIVDWVLEANVKKSAKVLNYWNPDAVEAVLKVAPVPLVSWDQLEKITKARCPQLTFGDDAFIPLDGHPFVSSAAQRLLFILDTLNRFKTCFDADGQRTPEGHKIYRDYFTGKKEDGGCGVLFSDSSDSEKNEFEQEMTFPHPEDANKTLFCTWHGKVQTPWLRVHFSWPIRADEPLYVMYVGPKITKR